MFRVVALLLIPAIPAVPAIAFAEDKPTDFVDVATVIPDAVIDIKYATKDNFTGEVLYPTARCKLRRAVATRLAKAAELLRKQDRRLLLWDCYRPSDVQKILWKHLPDERYVANPKKGSMHSRGAAIDLGIVDKDGGALVMPTAFDASGPASHRSAALRGETGVEAKRLETAMAKAGFKGLSTEWWHFDAPDTYSLSNDPL